MTLSQEYCPKSQKNKKSTLNTSGTFWTAKIHPALKEHKKYSHYTNNNYIYSRLLMRVQNTSSTLSEWKILAVP